MEMRILVESYNNVKQNEAGGIQVRISKFLEYGSKNNLDIHLYNQWEDKILDYDLLHIFKATFEEYPLIKMAKKNGIPVVISSIVASENAYKIFFNLLLCKLLPVHTGYWFVREVMELADVVIAQTEIEKKFISRIYKIDKAKIYVIPNGVNVKFKQEYKTIFPARTGIYGKFVLQVGRFDRNKNQLNVIKALNCLEIPVVFIGGEDINNAENIEYYKECQKIAKKNIHFLGWVKNNDPLLASAYMNAQAVILPSFKEIFGNSLIEGGAAGANLIATNVLPIKAWGIDKYCKVINPADINDIREKVVQAFNEAKNVEANSFFEKNFSWDSVIEQHNEIYSKLIQKSKKIRGLGGIKGLG